MGAPSPSPDVDGGLSLGAVLDGRYRIDAVLGAGGMGRVYRGEHTGIGRAVAIKVLHADLTRNREAAQRFQREALASGRLDHPNIVSVSDFGIVDDGPCYLVMEALEGESLGARLDRERRIPWPEALDILRGVLLGLRHAHDRGVVHRDIKPDNVFLARKDGDTIVKILDFGIAKLYAGSADDPASTRAGLTVGTPAYLSPEQAVGGEIKPASDLYSTTILLFEMLTGRPPFDDPDPLAMLGAHVSRTPPRLDEVAPGLAVPPGLEEVIQHGLAKTQAERIASAQDYLAALDRVVAGARGSAPHVVPPPVEGAQLGVAPTASFVPVVPVVTPVPGAPASYATPSPGTLSPMAAALPAAATLPARADSVAGGGLPAPWLKRGAIALGAIVGLGLFVALATSDGDDAAPARAVARPGASSPPAAVSTITVPVPVVDKETRLKALLHDLERGKTCAERKAAIPGLVDLGDERAVTPLKRARYRMRGGVFGLGDDNTNACLKADAEAAIKALSKP